MKQIKPIFQKKTPRDAEWARLEKEEKKFQKGKMEKRDLAWQRMLEEKVPDQLQKTLDFAFCKAFSAVFEKGTSVIEKTYKKEQTERDYKISAYTLSLKEDKKTLRAFSKQANKSGTKNVLVSGVEGVGLGILGIGIPDIPLLVGMMLKSVYQISLHYGIAYDTEKERYFIMELIRGSFSYGEEYQKIEKNLETFLSNEMLPENYIKKEQIAKTSEAVSKELLCMKFLQGIPVVGVVGGVFDAIYIKQLVKYADLKYRKRFLQNLEKENINKAETKQIRQKCKKNEEE